MASIIDVRSLPADFCQLVSSTMGYLLNRTLFCLTTFFATITTFQYVQPVAAQQYLLGLVYIGDITGPVVETNMMGYASLSQTDTGLHMIQRTRAFLIADANNPSNRVLFLNLDTAMGDSGIRRGILAALQQQFPGVYSERNVAVVGTHQHSGVGGYLENVLPQLTSLGFVNQTYQAIVTGSVIAVTKAHANLAAGTIFVGNAIVLNANINRSPSAYLANPAAERAHYQFDQDKDMTLLRFNDASGNARVFLCFFAVHGTSLYNNNTLISGDNKCMAAYLAEAAAEPNSMPGATSFVAGFSQSNVGDTRSSYVFTLANGLTIHTSPPAMGFSFAAGTTNGPGAFDFIQSDNSSTPQNPFWELVKGAFTPAPLPEHVACQDPKPILLNIGYANTPYPWTPSVVHIQMLRIGQFVILVVPGEFTTMAGRCIREAMHAKLIADGVIGSNAYVVIAGPANTYLHYVTTREEYGVERYEGASTIFGQFTLEAYVDIYSKLTGFIADNVSRTPPQSAAPLPDLTKNAISLQTGVIFDTEPLFKKFGDVLSDVKSTYSAGQTVSAQFVGADPRNNLRLEGTFLAVQQLANGQWKTVRSDSHPSTTFEWIRVSTILATSTVTLNWTIESGTPSGTYHIQYFGDSKPVTGSIISFMGTSGNFTVT
ncbi:hypothetical protein M422DRAFT_38146 [Sphaerobolus stellatus SS14]|uniref:Neutral ceramidase n=1 Tax=Sphaerobolus stellatus (strain SS14) TaxID=990650 RepID=A0A0C9TXS5_SPHS4|nr:hypothetical protein M422DRAFT_38146 [Sphaerobolus stellatus SS14]